MNARKFLALALALVLCLGLLPRPALAVSESDINNPKGYYFIYTNSWEEDPHNEDCFLVDVVGADGSQTAVSMTTSLWGEMSKDSNKFSYMNPADNKNVWLGKFVKVDTVDENGIISELDETGIVLGDIAVLGDDVVQVDGEKAYCYDNLTQFLYVDLVMNDGDDTTTEYDDTLVYSGSGAFNPDGFYKAKDVGEPEADFNGHVLMSNATTTYRSVKMVVIPSPDDIVADFVYVVRVMWWPDDDPGNTPLTPSDRTLTGGFNWADLTDASSKDYVAPAWPDADANNPTGYVDRATFYINGAVVDADEAIAKIKTWTYDINANADFRKLPGTVVEFYLNDDGEIGTVKAYHYTVTQLEGNSETRTYGGKLQVRVPGVAGLSSWTNADRVIGYQGLVEGDVVLWYCDTDDRSVAKYVIEKAEKITGKVVGTNSSKAIIVNGEKYKRTAPQAMEGTLTPDGNKADQRDFSQWNANDRDLEFNFYLDKNGTVCYTEQISDSVNKGNVALVLAAEWTGIDMYNSSGLLQAKLLFIDGTTDIVTVSKVDMDGNGLKQVVTTKSVVESTAARQIIGGPKLNAVKVHTGEAGQAITLLADTKIGSAGAAFFNYKVVDGKYELTKVIAGDPKNEEDWTDTVSANNVAIDKVADFTDGGIRYSANSRTTFVVAKGEPGEKKFYTYVSFKNVPACEDAYVLAVGTYDAPYTARYVYIDTIDYAPGEPEPITRSMFTVDTDAETYTGQPITKSVYGVASVYGVEGDTALVEGTDYTVAYTNNINVGTATITITGIGSYAGTLTYSFTIKAASSSGDSSTLLTQSMFTVDTATETYTGKAITKSVYGVDGDTKLVEGTDYTVAYKDNTNVGTATITITGVGDYTGTLTYTFAIKAASSGNNSSSSGGGSRPSGGGGGSSGGGGGSTTTPPPTQAGTPASELFTDVVKDSWYEPGVTYVVNKGLFKGMSEGIFSPNTTMTRAMVMTVLARIDGQDTTNAANGPWYTDIMRWAVAKGITDGTMPDSGVTREQLVTLLYRYAKATATTGDLAAFSDGNRVSAWAVGPMTWAVKEGIITGKDGARLDPQGTATRAEVATIFQRFVENK